MATPRDFSGGPGAWPVLEEGANWVVSFRKGTMSNPNNPIEGPDADFTPTDVTGWTVTMRVRESDAGGPSGGGRLLLDTSAFWTVDGPNGRFTMDVPAAQTVGLNFTSGVYAIELNVPDGTVIRQWEGNVTYSPRVNRG